MEITAKTYYGLEAALEQELRDMGAADVRSGNRMVTFSGNQELLYRVNYHSRLATSVLKPVVRFKARGPDELYQKVFEVSWEPWLDLKKTFSIKPVVHSPHFPHSKFASLRMKDAIADRFRKDTGRRPSVDPHRPDVLLNMHISQDNVTISLDSSGEILAHRGYRRNQTEAPLSEVLAAGMLLLSGWKPGIPLLDPMCGSATLSIEAALLAGNIAPGSLRRDFGFTHWKDFSVELYEKVRAEADRDQKDSEQQFRASDISAQAIRIARKNIESAGVRKNVRLMISDFMEVFPQEEKGMVILNPPYGERLTENARAEFYEQMGNHLKRNFSGYEAWIISANKPLLKRVGLHPEKKYRLYNGPLECHFWKFSLY